MPRIPQSQSAGALPGVGKATPGLQQNGGFVLGNSSRMTWGTIDATSDGPTAAMVKGWPRWAIPGFLDEVPPRLEGCRQRLLAAEIELGRAEKAGGLDIGNSAPPEADEVPAVLQDLPPLFGPEDGPDEFADLPHEGEMLLEQVSELESQLTSMTGKFKDLDAGHLAARQLRNSYSAQITSSTEQISSLAKRISELTEQLDVSQRHNEALKGNVIASRENTQKLQKQLLDCGKELSLSQYQGRKLEQLVESTRGVVDDYRSKLEQSETEHQNLRDRLRDTEKANRAAKNESEQRIEELEEALQEAEERMQEVTEGKEDLERQKKDLAESLQSQKDATVAQEKTVQDLQKFKVEEERLKEKMQKDLEQRQKQIDTLSIQLEEMTAQTKQDQPEADHATRPEVSEEERARIKKLEEALREAEKSIDEVKVQKDDIEKQKQELTESLQSQKDATAAQEKLVEEKEKELAALNRKLEEMQNVEHGENQPEADHATRPEASEEEIARIKKLEEALREAEKQKDDIEKQKQELTESLQSQKDATAAQEKLVEEKEKELAALNRKLEEMPKAEHGENQPEADHATRPEASEEEMARIKKLEEALREAEKSIDEVKVQKDDIEKQKQELTESLQSQKDATAAQEKLVEEKEKELAALNRKLEEMQKVAMEEPVADSTIAEEPDPAERAAKQAVSQWVDAATQVERSASKAQQEEWLSEWDSENVSLAVPVVMAAGVYEHGRAPSRVGLKGADFLIQPLLPAGPPQRLKLSNVMSIFAESHAETLMSQSVSLVLDVDEGGQKRQLQLSSDEESAEAILATLTRDVRVMPGEELKGR